MVWTSPERHGAMTGFMKAQIDWIPLSLGVVRPTQGKTLAVMEVSGGSQSFNAGPHAAVRTAHNIANPISDDRQIADVQSPVERSKRVESAP